LLLKASAQTVFGSSDSSSLLLTAGLGARVEDSGVQNLSLDTSVKYTRRQSKKRLLFLGISASYGHNLDLDQLFEMGGDSGLRGYPLRYQTGDKRAVLTVEHRYFTDWHPFRLFRVGGAVFFDAGRVWGEQPGSSSQSGLLRDVGFGLRIASDRSGVGRMTHIDVAFPLDGGQGIDDVQFLVSTKKSF
jgi:outer membrane protein assembly factor BamA